MFLNRQRIVVLGLLVGAAASLVWLAARPPTIIRRPVAYDEEQQETAGPSLAAQQRESPPTEEALPPIDPAWVLAEMQSGGFERQRKAYLAAMNSSALPYHEGLARWLAANLTGGGWISRWSQSLLGKMGPAAAGHVTPLFTSKSAHERRAALKVAVRWKQHDGEPVMPPVVDLLKDPDRTVQNWAWMYASTGMPYDKQVAEYMLSIIEPVNGVAFNGPEVTLARMGPDGIAHLLAMLDDPSEELWLNALGGLASAPAAAIKKLQSKLAAFIRHEDEDVAMAAIEVLHMLEGDSEASVPALTTALGHESVIVLDAALQVFEQMGDRAAAAAPAVLKLLQYENERVVNRAAGVLGQFKTAPETVMPALARAAKDDVSESAAAALAAFGPPAMAHALKAYDEADEDGRYALLLTFRALGPQAAGAVPRLMEALEGDDYLIQTRAIQALGRIGPDAAAAVPAIRRQMDLGTVATNTAARTLIRLGPQGEAAVIELLRTKDDKRRRDLVVALSFAYGRTGFALDVLERVAKRDPVAAIRRAALQAVFVAMSVPDRPWTNAQADPALVARVRGILLAHAKDSNESVRAYAVGAIGELPGN